MKEEGRAQFVGQDYINIESFKKNGEGVLTPVWFAESGDRFYVYSLANAGKVKRIRNNPHIRIAPCTMTGAIRGEWVDAEARIAGADEERRGHELLNKKYGLKKKIGDFFSRLRKRERAVITIKLK